MPITVIATVYVYFYLKIVIQLYLHKFLFGGTLSISSEIEMATRVQILDETVFHFALIPFRETNLSLLLQAVRRIIRQTGFFSLNRAISRGEGKALNSKPDEHFRRISDRASPFFYKQLIQKLWLFL